MDINEAPTVLVAPRGTANSRRELTMQRIPAQASRRGQDPAEALVDASREALRLLERIDAHAPEGLAFGGEGRVRRLLREALRLADAPPAPDPRNYETSEAFEAAESRYEEELRIGPMGEREREAFERGFLEARAEQRRG